MYQVYDSTGNITNRKTLSRQASAVAKVEGVPRYKDFNTIRKNHHVKDEEVLRYVPYFGESDDIDFKEVYRIEVRSPEEEEELERTLLLGGYADLGAKNLSRIVERFLEINGLTVDQTLPILEDEENSKKTNSEAVSLLRSRVLRVADYWEEKTDVELDKVLKSYPHK